MRWMIKAAAQRAIGMLPYRRRWYELFQRHVSGSLKLSTSSFETKLGHCRRHVAHLREFCGRDSFTAFELGTGWFPILPVGMYLCGADEVWTCDIEGMLRPRQVRRVLELFVEYAQRGRLGELLPDHDAARVEQLRSVLALPPSTSAEQLLGELRIRTLVADAQRLPLEDSSVDFIESNEVLEYVPSEVLAAMHTEFRRILRPSGVMSHFIGLGDEYAYFDPAISPFNFLRFSESAWRYIRNPFAPLSRLRIDDYRGVTEQAGFAICREDNQYGKLADLQRVPLAQRFKNCPQEDLLILFTWMVSQPTKVPADKSMTTESSALI